MTRTWIRLLCLRCRKCGTGGYLLTSTSNHKFDSCVTDSSVLTNQHGPGRLTPPNSCSPSPSPNMHWPISMAQDVWPLPLALGPVHNFLRIKIFKTFVYTPFVLEKVWDWWHHTGCDITARIVKCGLKLYNKCLCLFWTSTWESVIDQLTNIDLTSCWRKKKKGFDAGLSFNHFIEVWRIFQQFTRFIWPFSSNLLTLIVQMI